MIIEKNVLFLHIFKCLIMTDSELYNDLVAMLPVKRNNNKGFKQVINDLFANFKSKVSKYNIFTQDKNDLNEINFIANTIKEILILGYEGRNSAAFQKLYSLLDGNQNMRLSLLLRKYITNGEGKNEDFYRLRKFENRRDIPHKEMFHIPFDKREKVMTQRYSIPGYPCLYLGKSVYGCWEELGRPYLDSFMVSRYNTKDNLLFIDLTIPTKECLMTPSSFLTELYRFPFILACMIQVKDEKATFKPEYLFPQLMMEFIIEKYHQSSDKSSAHNYIGIYYTSVYKNDEFGYDGNVFNNCAIPTFETTKESKYCPVLCKHFKLTSPTCEEYERIKTAGESNLYWNDNRTDYEKSSFGMIEHALNNENRFPLKEMLPGKLIN